MARYLEPMNHAAASPLISDRSGDLHIRGYAPPFSSLSSRRCFLLAELAAGVQHGRRAPAHQMSVVLVVADLG
ncbi:hypothetical protein AQJ67_24780 [Streptomyces caeruleatus]|uniref:Uncharacterized protein n=1 Tax=Streptomyces caeruleatus TaxID=661399 RepID=A0A101TXB9_9ACTN|nr:hypothetical protein AQJ67_24780 [Streptomyces caeruleatus]